MRACDSFERPCNQAESVVSHDGASALVEGTPLSSIRAPVLALHGENDARMNASIRQVDSAFRADDRSFGHHTSGGAGHGFLRQQRGADGAKLAASHAAWPRTISFFRMHLEQ